MCRIQDRFLAVHGFSPTERCWTIGSIHGDIDRLIELHDELLSRFQSGDKIIYTGNYIGYGYYPRETLEELLSFRRVILSIPGVTAHDIVYLRGSQEEILSKLAQLPFAPDPEAIYNWMITNGLAETLEGLDIDRHDGLYAARSGVMALCRWTGQVKTALKSVNGYDHFMGSLRKAAHSNLQSEGPMLFVNAGISFNKPLDDQGDSFWWGTKSFNTIHAPYAPFSRIVRGYDPDHEGLYVNGVTATIDGGCGFGGTLACAGFDRGAELFDLFEA
ncbi:MAG: hypothetical protein AB7E85_00270 [Pseudobdellovibrionaceae bacterium]